MKYSIKIEAYTYTLRILVSSVTKFKISKIILLSVYSNFRHTKTNTQCNILSNIKESVMSVHVWWCQDDNRLIMNNAKCMTVNVWTVTNVENPKWCSSDFVFRNFIFTCPVQRIAVVFQIHVKSHLNMQSDFPSSVRGER